MVQPRLAPGFSSRPESHHLLGVTGGEDPYRAENTSHTTHGTSSHMTAVLTNGSHQGPAATWADGSPRLLDPTSTPG